MTLTTRQGTLNFAAIEAVMDQYIFHPFDEGRERRVFLYTPLHDYESVWWIAAWVVFSCTLETAQNDGRARDALLTDRASFAELEDIMDHGQLLPKELHSLVKILDEMRYTLVRGYYAYEKNFDGTNMLDVVPSLIGHLEDLAKAAETIEIKPLHVPSTVDRSDMAFDIREDDVFEEGKGDVPGGRG